MTIYEVIENFMVWTMPEAIYLAYEPLMIALNLFLTMIVVFSFILIPLYRIATFFLRKAK